MTKTNQLTAMRARELFEYSPRAGTLRWRFRKGKKIGPDLIAGYIDHEGYRVVRVDGVNYRGHRLIWLIVHGKWPRDMLDHINGERSDNRLENLREATNAQNQMNKKGRQGGASGYKGVSIIRRRGRIQYRPQITVGGKAVVMGYYDTPEAAYAVYCREAVRAFGEFAKT